MRAEALVLSLQFYDSTVKLLHEGRELLGREALRDVLRTVEVPCLDMEDERSLGLAGVVWSASCSKSSGSSSITSLQPQIFTRRRLA